MSLGSCALGNSKGTFWQFLFENDYLETLSHNLP